MANPDENKFQTGSNTPQANESSVSDELILLEDEEEITILEDVVEPQKKRAPSLLKKENLPTLAPQAINSIEPEQIVEEEWGYETTQNGLTTKVSLAIIVLLVSAIIGAGFYFRYKKASREEEVATGHTSVTKDYY